MWTGVLNYTERVFNNIDMDVSNQLKLISQKRYLYGIISHRKHLTTWYSNCLITTVAYGTVSFYVNNSWLLGNYRRWYEVGISILGKTMSIKLSRITEVGRNPTYKWFWHFNSLNISVMNPLFEINTRGILNPDSWSNGWCPVCIKIQLLMNCLYVVRL